MIPKRLVRQVQELQDAVRWLALYGTQRRVVGTPVILWQENLNRWVDKHDVPL